MKYVLEIIKIITNVFNISKGSVSLTSVYSKHSKIKLHIQKAENGFIK